jgi:hypothetical protein
VVAFPFASTFHLNETATPPTMSKSLSKPWLRTTALELVGEGKPSKGKNYTRLPSKTVQVIKVNEEMSFLVVNDSENTIPVMLTQKCVQKLRASGEVDELGDLRYTVVTLEKYFYSSTIQSGGPRDTGRLMKLGVSLPLALQCDEITMQGGDGCDIMGEPVDVNKDERVRSVISRLQFITMTQRLATKQFPDYKVLPNYGP